VVTSDSRGMKQVAIDIALNAIVEAPKHCQKCCRQMLVNIWLELVVLGLCYSYYYYIHLQEKSCSIGRYFCRYIPPIWLCKRGAWQTIRFRVLLFPQNFYNRVATDDGVSEIRKNLCP
jgi:hypothetical protein